jgi:two-component system cell cycle response regulator
VRYSLFLMNMENAKTILVIEDDDVQRELMRMTLERRGYSVVTADDGIPGYDQAVIISPDLIVTDIRMPGADGIHLVQRVRDTPEIAETPILVTTGYGTGMAAFSLAEGADGYEPKPFNPESLVASVERLLAQP